ncbi:MAG: peptidoglycan editing factor PgeF [Burkholderiaceae bacterium]
MNKLDQNRLKKHADQIGLSLIHAPWSGAGGVYAATTTRAGGNSQPPFDDGLGSGGLNLADHVGDEAGAVSSNRAHLAKLLPGPVMWLNQVHGIEVLCLPKTSQREHQELVTTANGAEDAPTADAAATNQPGRVLTIMTADCLPVLLCDPDAGVVGAAHAGWRGLAAGVLPATILAMRELGARAGAIKAWIGPAIGAQAFEVGTEVLSAFRSSPSFSGIEVAQYFQPKPGRDAKLLGDLPGLAIAQLCAAGLTSMSAAPHCTVEDAGLFSYRRDGQTGRMASFIWFEAH